MLTITLTGEEAENYLKLIAPVSTPVAAISASTSTTTEDRWKRLVDANIPVTSEYNRWTTNDLAVLDLAVDKRSKYYSIDTLCRYLGRSRGAIISAANRRGYVTADNYIKSSL